MKIKVLLLASLVSLMSCNASKENDPRPADRTLSSSHRVNNGGDATASSTYLEFQLFDAADGDQFNTALNARVYYFPLSWSESRIQNYFGNPDTNSDWDDSPRPADEEIDFDNVVAPGTTYGWSANPGFIHLDLASQQQIAIVWTYVDASPTCRRSYRQQLFIWNGLGENYRLTTDQFRAGL